MSDRVGEDSLSRIVEASAPVELDDALYLAEAQEFEDEAAALRLEDRRELLKGKKQDRRERKRYADLVFRLVCWWLLGVSGLVVSAGLDKLALAEPVLMTLVGSTTASVVAIFVVVAKYLFPVRD